MKPKEFFSQLFRRIITTAEPEYWSVVYAELLFRIDDLTQRKCHCHRCIEDLAKYQKTLQHLKTQRTPPFTRDS